MKVVADDQKRSIFGEVLFPLDVIFCECYRSYRKEPSQEVPNQEPAGIRIFFYVCIGKVFAAHYVLITPLTLNYTAR